MVKRTTHKILLSHNTNPALYKCFGRFFCIVKHDAESGVNAVSPLYSVVIEHEVEIRGFYTASDVFFYGERYLCNVRIHACISQGDFLCFSYIDMIIEEEYLARFRVDFVTILIFCRVKLQNPARTTGIAAQFFFGKHDFHFVLIFIFVFSSFNALGRVILQSSSNLF